MNYSTPDLCDEYPGFVRVVEPMFLNFGGKSSFGGEIVTIKCFEDNSLVKENAAKSGKGKVLVVDGGGSMRRALCGDLVAKSAMDNGWEGLIIYGCIRDVDQISDMEIGMQALGTIPLKTEKKGIGDMNIPLGFGGVTFNPGEYIYADNNGIIVSSKQLHNS
ncbi:MAG: putative 4-hydroxy-4-methyl-2-oxoglutarate aldolase [Candidatus Dadabacteria bacterium]|nr:putative 4-hydroxy-4-methyl-2-oxoglutarate aldolase [Candidatus Dadabacteria bacterium]NIQ14862.1 putative 4-hydroxy-4-methyl-2-oxoglutarate aldolase [Candidatus Dadabacteria bacterium]